MQKHTADGSVQLTAMRTLDAGARRRLARAEHAVLHRDGLQVAGAYAQKREPEDQLGRLGEHELVPRRASPTTMAPAEGVGTASRRAARPSVRKRPGRCGAVTGTHPGPRRHPSRRAARQPMPTQPGRSHRPGSWAQPPCTPGRARHSLAAPATSARPPCCFRAWVERARAARRGTSREAYARGPQGPWAPGRDIRVAVVHHRAISHPLQAGRSWLWQA
jgi:hypothetical protein